MKRISLLAPVAVLSVGLLLFIGASDPAKVTVGSKAPSFSLKDVEANTHTLDEYLKSKYTVLMFIATQCPVSNDYNSRMADLYDAYASKEISFVGINSNRQEGVEEIKKHAEKNGFKFAVLKDVENMVADAYGAAVTPEVFVLDSKGVVCYHGRIDDNRDAEEVQSRDLSAALDALLGGKEVPRAEAKAFGCTIKRVKKAKE